MRIHILNDSTSCSPVATGPFQKAIPDNDNSRQLNSRPNVAETYLMTLAPGSRRTMAQALDTIAGLIMPGATAANLDWARVGYAEVVMVRSELASRYAPSTANKVMAALRGALKSACRLGLLSSDSFSRAIDVPRVRGTRGANGRCLDATEISRLIAACDLTIARGVRNAAMVALAFGCGLRRAELVSLNLDDAFDGGKAFRVLGKGAKQRTVYLPAGALTYLDAWLERRGGRPGPLFCAISRKATSDGRLTQQTVYDVLRMLAKNAAVDRISPHDLRRAFVSSLLDQGVSLSTVAAMAGHADVSTTARYDRRGERAKREAVKHLAIALPVTQSPC